MSKFKFTIGLLAVVLALSFVLPVLATSTDATPSPTPTVSPSPTPTVTPSPTPTVTPSPTPTPDNGDGAYDELMKQILAAIEKLSKSQEKMEKLFDRQMKYGDEGEDVRGLQRELNSYPYSRIGGGGYGGRGGYGGGGGYSGPGSRGRETTSFGDLTKAALQAYQRYNGIPESGYMDQRTNQVMAQTRQQQGLGQGMQRSPSVPQSIGSAPWQNAQGNPGAVPSRPYSSVTGPQTPTTRPTTQPATQPTNTQNSAFYDQLQANRANDPLNPLARSGTPKTIEEWLALAKTDSRPGAGIGNAPVVGQNLSGDDSTDSRPGAGIGNAPIMPGNQTGIGNAPVLPSKKLFKGSFNSMKVCDCPITSSSTGYTLFSVTEPVSGVVKLMYHPSKTLHPAGWDPKVVLSKDLAGSYSTSEKIQCMVKNPSTLPWALPCINYENPGNRIIQIGETGSSVPNANFDPKSNSAPVY